jgi:tetratricopeptide (TPR) repeat protein
MKVCTEVLALPNMPALEKGKAEAKAKMNLYTNNKIATLQQANDFDGIIAMSETLEDKALAQKVSVQAYLLKKDYDKVIELGEAAAEAQTDEADKSAVYFQLGTAYNAKEMKDKAVAALSKVTAGPSVEAAKAAIAGLTAPAK